MNQRKKSQEELFLHKLYELASRRGDSNQSIDRYEVSRAIGRNDKTIDNTVQMLAKNGLLKRGEGSYVSLTAQGVSFVKAYA